MGPPASVTIASPIPNDYFAPITGALAGWDGTWNDKRQPLNPVMHGDVTTPIRTVVAGTQRFAAINPTWIHPVSFYRQMWADLFAHREH